MRTRWTPEQIDTLSRMYWDHYATEIAVVLGRSVRSVYDKARLMGLKCNPEKIRRSGMMSSNHPNTIAHRFSKGHIPDNKGKRMSPEVYAQVQRTMFKKGHRPPITWTPRMINTLREYYPTMFNDALAKLIKVSVRSLQRKAQELGLVKVKDFNQVRAYDISKRISDAVKKAYSDGRKTSDFQKGVRNNPDGEFKPGHRFPEEIETARKDKIRKTFKRQKLLQIYGLK